MGCTTSAAASADRPRAPAEAQDVSEKNDEGKREKTSDDRTPRDHLPMDQSGMLSMSTPVRESSSHISIVADDDQDLFVPPLTPRKTREIERWLEGLVVPINEDDALRAQISRRNSDVDSIRTDATAGTQGTVTDGVERRVDQAPVTLTHENIQSHINMLAQKDGKAKQQAARLHTHHNSPPPSSKNAEYGNNSGIFSITPNRVFASDPLINNAAPESPREIRA